MAVDLSNDLESRISPLKCQVLYLKMGTAIAMAVCAFSTCGLWTNAKLLLISVEKAAGQAALSTSSSLRVAQEEADWGVSTVACGSAVQTEPWWAQSLGQHWKYFIVILCDWLQFWLKIISDSSAPGNMFRDLFRALLLSEAVKQKGIVCCTNSWYPVLLHVVYSHHTEEDIQELPVSRSSGKLQRALWMPQMNENLSSWQWIIPDDFFHVCVLYFSVLRKMVAFKKSCRNLEKKWPIISPWLIIPFNGD